MCCKSYLLFNFFCFVIFVCVFSWGAALFDNYTDVDNNGKKKKLKFMLEFRGSSEGVQWEVEGVGS